MFPPTRDARVGFHTSRFSMKYQVVNSNLNVEASNKLGFNILKRLEHEGRSIISPLSLFLALAVAYNGAAGTTKDEMAQTLNVQKIDTQKLNALNKDLIEVLESLNSSRISLAIANSLWLNQKIAVNSEFIESGQIYQAKVTAVDFASSVATINEWVRARTGGKIDRVVNGLDESAALYIINALYFKGEWARQFDERLTREGVFHSSKGRMKQHFMFQNGSFDYFESEQFQAIRLPYSEKCISLSVFLPRAGVELEDFFSCFSAGRWLDWRKRFELEKGSLLLPRFKLEYSCSLKETLCDLGMAEAFDPRQANFDAISSVSPGIYIRDVFHKTYIEVNEVGTEAAAVTAIEGGIRGCSVERQFVMTVNRPFLFVISEEICSRILFVGSVKELGSLSQVC